MSKTAAIIVMLGLVASGCSSGGPKKLKMPKETRQVVCGVYERMGVRPVLTSPDGSISLDMSQVSGPENMTLVDQANDVSKVGNLAPGYRYCLAMVPTRWSGVGAVGAVFFDKPEGYVVAPSASIR